jgi:hypothetical protein
MCIMFRRRRRLWLNTGNQPAIAQSHGGVVASLCPRTPQTRDVLYDSSRPSRLGRTLMVVPPIRSSLPVAPGRCWKALVAPGNRPRTLPTKRSPCRPACAHPATPSLRRLLVRWAGFFNPYNCASILNMPGALAVRIRPRRVGGPDRIVRAA